MSWCRVFVHAPQVLLDREDVNHNIPIEQSSGCGHCVRRREIPLCLCECVLSEYVFMGVPPTVLVCDRGAGWYEELIFRSTCSMASFN